MGFPWGNARWRGRLAWLLAAFLLFPWAITGWTTEGLAQAKAPGTAPVEAPGEAREPARIEYREILKDPDNISLNFRFARQQVQDGNIKGASATLERILLIQPDLAVVRLFYTAVLIRLDSLAEASQQLELVQASGDPAVAAQVERYRTARGGSGKLNSWDRWIFRATAA